MPTRQTSSSGRPKSPRIQVVLPEDLCDRLAVLAELEARTVSNMARVLIQQGVERLESLQGLEPGDPRTEAAGAGPRSLRSAPEGTPLAERSRAASSGSPRDGMGPDRLESDRFESDGPGRDGLRRDGLRRDEAVLPRGGMPSDERSGGVGRRDERFGPGASASSRGGAQGRRNRPQGKQSPPPRSVGAPSQSPRSGDTSFSAEVFRAELERQGQDPAPRTQKPRRLRIWRPS